MNNNMNISLLGDLGKVSMCKRVLKHQTSENGDIPFYKISTFGGVPNTFISNELYESFLKKYSYPKIGDILISAAGTIGKTVVFDGVPSYFQDSNIVWIANDESKVINQYLYYYYLTKPWIPTSGSTIKRLYNDNIRNLKISYPEIPIQKQIIKVLSDLDAKIELNKTVNAELEAIAKLIYDYWFVQFDFPDKNGKPYKSSGGKMVYNEELKRDIPEGWEADIIGNLLAKEQLGGKTPSSEYLSSGKIPIIDQSTNFICGYTNDEAKRIETKVPRIVFGDHTRILKLINFDFARGADGTQVLLSKEERVPQHFLYHSILKIDLSNYGYARHFKFLKDTKTIIPAIDIVDKFDEKAKVWYDLIWTNKKQNQKLAELRDWLLPMLMNGQVKVG